MAIDPYTALTIGKSVMGFIDANNQYKQQEAAFLRNRQDAAIARDQSVAALNKRAAQEMEASAGKQIELQIQALQEAETRKVVSGESGVAGQTEQLKLADVEARELRAKDVISGNLDMMLDQIEEQKMGVNAQMKNRINSMPRGQKPNIMAHAIGAAASAYAAEADVTGKNLFTGKALAKTMPNYVVPATTGFSGIMGSGQAPLPNTLQSNVMGSLTSSTYPSIFNRG